MKKIFLLSLFCFISCQSFKSYDFLCYYNGDVKIKELNNYNFLILDPDHYDNVFNIKSKMKLAYLSVGEVGSYRKYWDNIKDKSWVGTENKNWRNDYRVDIRSEEWQSLLLDNIIPGILSRGYNGLFLDTVNEAIFDYDNDMESGEKIDKLIIFLEKLRKQYPDIYILQNQGLSVINKTFRYVQGILYEGLTSSYDFKTKKYYKVNKKKINNMLGRLVDLRKKYHLDIFIIDYVNEDAKDNILLSKRNCKKNKFNLYLANIGLDRIYKF